MHKNIQISKNKSIEFQSEGWGLENGLTIFEIVARSTWKTDHGGFTFEITILNLFFMVNFYDHRHWDAKANDYEN